MNKSFYRFFVAIMTFALVATSAYSLVPKKVLMEDHTGAWCGWCVLGNQAMEDMLEEYQSNFIPVAIHNGNDALIHPQQATLAQAMGVTGYPSGVMNRTTYTFQGSTTKIFHPSVWPDLVSAHINDMSPVEVQVTYNLDKTAKTLTATVKAIFNADVTGQLNFNLYVLEDDMVATAQQNYLSGRAGYENHPYYKLPAVISGYKHKNVLLDMLGGLYGTPGTFPAAGVKAGETYEYTFNFDLNNLAVKSMNLDNMWFVGLVEKSQGQYEILNSTMVGKKLPLPRYKAEFANAEIFQTVVRNNQTKKTLELTNNSAKELTVDVAINATKNIPADWTVTVTPAQVVIPANSKQTVEVTVQAGATAYYGEVIVDAAVKPGTDFNGGSSSAYIGSLSDGIDFVVYHFNDGRLAPLTQVINVNSTLQNKIALIPMASGPLTAFANYNFKLAIVPETYMSRGAFINNTDGVNFVNSMIQKGKGVLFTSIIDNFFVAGNYSSLIPDQATKTLFNTTWGISGPTQSAPLAAGSGQTVNAIPVVGNSDDITKGWSTTLNQYNSQSFPYYTFFLDQVIVKDATRASIISTYNITTSQYTNAAAKIQTPTNRNIYCGFSFDLIADVAARTTLFGNMVTWLLGGTDVNFDETNAAKLSVYPNPVNNASTISFEVPSGISAAEVFVMDINGNKVMNLDAQNLNEGLNSLNLNAGSLASGSYYVITNINGNYSFLPFVIQK